MVGLDYWYMPTFPSDMRHAYGAMVAINLPWFSGRRAADQREAEESLQADRHAPDRVSHRVGLARQAGSANSPGPRLS